MCVCKTVTNYNMQNVEYRAGNQQQATNLKFGNTGLFVNKIYKSFVNHLYECFSMGHWIAYCMPFLQCLLACVGAWK